MIVASRLLDRLPILGERRQVIRRVEALIRERAEQLPAPGEADAVARLEAFLRIVRGARGGVA